MTKKATKAEVAAQKREAEHARKMKASRIKASQTLQWLQSIFGEHDRLCAGNEGVEWHGEGFFASLQVSRFVHMRPLYFVMTLSQTQKSIDAWMDEDEEQGDVRIEFFARTVQEAQKLFMHEVGRAHKFAGTLVDEQKKRIQQCEALQHKLTIIRNEARAA